MKTSHPASTTKNATHEVKAPPALIRAQRLANLTDTAVKLPILNISVGLDFLIGLIPGLGDAIMLMASLAIVYSARQMDAPKALQKAMLRNSLLDFILGTVPIVGDLFDLFFKANQRNVRMLEQWWVSEHHQQLRENARRKLQDWQSKQPD